MNNPFYLFRLRHFFVAAGIVFLTAAGRANVQQLTDGKNASYDERHRASYQIGGQLQADEIEALLKFLVRLPAEDSARDDELSTLKNNAADALLQQKTPPSRLLVVFKTAFGDLKQGEVWREYVVQKLPELCGRLEGAPRRECLQFLRERLHDTDYIFAGTALIGLDRLHSSHPNLVEGGEVGRAAVALLESTQQADACKISALQILAHYDAPAALSRARGYLHAETPVMLKVSALAALGLVGQAEDLPIVERYAGSPELRLRTAARAALKQLKARA